jgi:hypothetical protein
VPSTIWTPRAVASEGFRLRRRLWRAVEAQHIASTLRLVGSAQEQAVLESILEASKPAIPPEAASLHYLLYTPFRYPSPFGSRFRSPTDPGVWYGAEALRTACAELGFWRWRFLTESEGLETLGPAPQTVFRASIDTKSADLTRGAFRRDHAEWSHRTNYHATQTFAALAREAELGAIRYESVRDPEHGAAVAVLRAQAFSPKKPLAQETWFLTVKRTRVTWQREGAVLEFASSEWAE